MFRERKFGVFTLPSHWPRRRVKVGNGLERDVRAGQRLGMRTVWLLRGDAPPAPTLDQLIEPDAVIISLLGLPMALTRLMGARSKASSVASSLDALQMNP